MTTMSADLTPIAIKLRNLIRMLSSNQDGEIIAAARAIGRTLASRGLDFHALADGIGETNGKKFTEADAAEIYRRGVEDGKREAESGPMFHNVNIDGEPTWHEIAVECAAYPDRLRNDRERDFVMGMVRRTVHGGRLSEKQAAWLRAIYARVR
jgi:hypothetical protein